MNSLEILMNKGRRLCAAILVMAAIAVYAMANSNLWPGVLLGVGVGYLNLEILYRRVGRTDPQDPAASLKLMRNGSGLRYTAAALGAWVAIKFQLSILGYALGLITPQILITVICAMHDYRERKG